MTIDQIKAAIERRGYSVQVEHYPHSVNFRISAGEKHMNCGYTLVDLKYWKYSLSDFVNAMLYRFSGTMHPIWCKQCHEPLLQETDNTPHGQVSIALVEILRTIPEVHSIYTDVYRYRSAKVGPDSPVLERCSGCGYPLDASTTEEIRDA